MAIVSIGTQTTTASLLGTVATVRSIIFKTPTGGWDNVLVGINAFSKTIYGGPQSYSGANPGPITVGSTNTYVVKGFYQPQKITYIDLYGNLYNNTITTPPYQFWS